MRRTLAGERRAVEDFCDRMSCVRRMVAFQNRKLGAPLKQDEIEDLVQETLTVVWRKLADYAGEGALESWVFRFTYLELLARLRQLRRLPQLLEDVDHPPEPEAELVPGAFEYERLNRSLGRLEPGAASIIRLKHFQECTFEEIGRRIGVPTNTAKTRYYRGLAKLRELLSAGNREGGAASAEGGAR
ncbi:MAG: RNA polymerase sigma factor [Planctomycetota bacterium]